MRHLLLILISIATLSACESIDSEAKYPTGAERDGNNTNDIYSEKKGIFGGGGINILGGKDDDDDNNSSGIGVNSFLWRASLDTISFMPLSSADPFGGVILTDWYNPPETPNERFKTNVFILGRELRSDGIRVRVFKQVYNGNTWRDVDVDPATATQLEDTILTRARQLRVAQAGRIIEE